MFLYAKATTPPEPPVDDNNSADDNQQDNINEDTQQDNQEEQDEENENAEDDDTFQSEEDIVIDEPAVEEPSFDVPNVDEPDVDESNDEQNTTDNSSEDIHVVTDVQQPSEAVEQTPAAQQTEALAVEHPEQTVSQNVQYTYHEDGLEITETIEQPATKPTNTTKRQNKKTTVSKVNANSIMLYDANFKPICSVNINISNEKEMVWVPELSIWIMIVKK